MELGVMVTGPTKLDDSKVVMIEHHFIYQVDGEPIRADILERMVDEGSLFMIGGFGWPGNEAGWTNTGHHDTYYQDLSDCLAAARDYLLRLEWEPKGTETCASCGGPSHGRAPIIP